jgi:hypothetical protein
MAGERQREDARHVDELHNLAKLLRAKQMKALESQFALAIGSEVSLTDSDAARRAGQRIVANAGEIVDQMRCYDPDIAAGERLQLDGYPSPLEAAIAREEACRADAKCVAERQAAPVVTALCEAIADRRAAADGQRAALAGIARERANPSGFVDKGLLHDLGAEAQGNAERVHEDDVNIASLRGQYAKIVRRSFVDASCPR